MACIKEQCHISIVELASNSRMTAAMCSRSRSTPSTIFKSKHFEELADIGSIMWRIKQPTGKTIVAVAEDKRYSPSKWDRRWLINLGWK